MLERAYQVFNCDYGFSYARRTLWPVQVHVYPLASNGSANYCPSSFGDNFGRIILNAEHLSDLDALGPAVAHEFFHFVQFLYDPRSAYDKARNVAAHTWVMEAGSVWCEELLATEDEGYVSDAFLRNPLAPLRGMQAGAQGDHRTMRDHGHGMASVFKHLVESEGDRLPLSVWQQIHAGRGPTEAVLRAVDGDVATWWPDVLRRLITGDLYTFPSEDLQQELSGTFRVGPDTTRVFHIDLPDLSAGLYRIEFRRGVGDSTRFQITAAGFESEATEILVFAGGDSSADFVARGAGELIVRDVHAYAARRRDLLVLVENHGTHPPDFISEIESETCVRLIVPQKYDHCEFRLLDLNVVVQTDGDSTRWEEHHLSADLDGDCSDGWFLGRREELGGGEFPDRRVQYLKVELDPYSFRLYRFSFIDSVISESQGRLTVWKVRGGRLPFNGTPDLVSPYLRFAQQGSSVYPLIDSFHYEKIGPTSHDVIQGLECDSETMLKIDLRGPPGAIGLGRSARCR
jgi:hypothetical protein